MDARTPSTPILSPLVLHKAESRSPRHQILAGAARIDGAVELTFHIENSQNVVWPMADLGLREDGLWRSTCFECFIGSSGDSYTEWNFAPNGKWAAYLFTGYRTGMTNAEVSVPTIRSSESEGSKKFTIRFEPIHPPVTFSGASLAPSVMRLSITAVILETGERDPFYWALHHAGEKPDFHLNDSFRLKMEF